MRILLLFTSIILAGVSFFNPEQEQANTIIDNRDGNEYQYIELNGLNWFLENLRYEFPESMCVSEVDSLCTECGQFYLMEDAFKACPTGWRLPTLNEVKGLIKLEKRNKVNLIEMLDIKLCGRIDNKEINKIGEQNTYWVDDKAQNGDIEHWHIFHNKQEVHSHNVVNAKRQFPVRCVCELK